MSERSERMKVALKRLFRLRPLAVTLAMMMIHIASKETTLAGTIDRLIQFAMAYALVAWAMKPNGSIGRCGNERGSDAAR